MKLCKDCKHFESEWDLCKHPELVTRVRGHTVLAEPLRRDDGECGKEAKHWEPK